MRVPARRTGATPTEFDRANTSMARFHRIPKRRDRPKPAGPWLHGPIPVLGLTGAIGAGKSLVASLLSQRGALVLDADAIGHALLDQRPARDQVVARFGTAVLQPAAEEGAPPTIDRRALGAIVFADPAALRALENILHPRMVRTFEKAIERAVRRGQATAVVLDAAILVEKGWNALCDRVVFVDAPSEQRFARLSAQRGWTEAELETRERAQWSADEKKRRANHTVSNAGDQSQLEQAVAQLWSEVQRSRPRVERRAPRSSASAAGGGAPAAAKVRPRRPDSRRKPSRDGHGP